MYIREAGHSLTKIELDKIWKLCETSYKKKFEEYKNKPKTKSKDFIDKNNNDVYTVTISEKGKQMDEFQKHKDLIDKMSQIEMAKLYRFAPHGHIYFDTSKSLYQYFEDRFLKLGGMTSEISKLIGWEE